MVSAIPQVRIDPSSPLPLYRQLYDALRAAVLERTLAPGTRLPATRELARELRLSRNTVMLAFEQLIAEGYLVGRPGAGTFVTESLPDEMLSVSTPGPMRSRRASEAALSERGRLLAGTRVSTPRAPTGLRAFRVGTPDVSEFPFTEWGRIVARTWRRPPPELLVYGDPAGYGPLREQIAAYVGAARAVRCDPSRVIVVSGSQQALELSARLLVDPGDEVWMEEPGYQGARAALEASGARVVPVPVDREGIDVTRGVELAPAARLVSVTPSHQFPLGFTLSLPRRMALLEWARDAGAWILEDDYDSEHRYAGRPLASLQGLDEHGRVIYFGTFSKVMFPSLRIGYVVAPPELVDAFIAARAIVDRHSPTVEQAALAEFMAEGHLGRHIRRMRALYAERQQILVEAARADLTGLLEVERVDTGMHLVGWLPEGVDDAAVSRAALRAGVDVTPVSSYYAGPAKRPGLMLGYSACDEATIRSGVRTLAGVIGTVAR